MLYDFNNDVHLADEVFVMSSRENDTITLDTFKSYQTLETADFNIITFNRDGRVLFDPWYRHSMLVDDCALITGQVLIVVFGPDGRATATYRVRCLDLFDPYMRIQDLGKRVEDQMEFFQSALGSYDPEHWSSEDAYAPTSALQEQNAYTNLKSVHRIDRKRLLLDILCIYRDLMDTPLDDDRETIEKGLNELAPGYLEAERAGDGLAKDFDLFNSGFTT